MTPPRGYEALEDAALVALVSEGDGAALEALYARYGRVAYALARRVLGDDALAAAAVREAFVGLWRAAGRYDAGRGSFASWLMSTTHHRAVESVRREENLRKRRTATDVLDFAETRAVPRDAWSGPRREAVRRALRDLPDAQREAVALAYFGGYTQWEVARLTDTPLGTVKSRMLAGLRRLRDVLDAADVEDAEGRAR